MRSDARNLQQTLDAHALQVGSRLADFRRKARLSVQDIINATGLSRSGIEKMESERSNPTVQSVEAYLHACGATLAEFFRPWTRTSIDTKRRKGELVGGRR